MHAPSPAIRGLHLLIEGTVGNPNRFAEPELREMCEEILGLIGRGLGDPVTFRSSIDTDDGCVTATGLAGGAHMGIHVWPLRRTFMVDMFANQIFEQAAALEILHRHFAPHGLSVRALVRAPDLPT